MNTFKRIIIKDYQNTSDINVRNKYGLCAGILGIIINFLLGLLKLLLGIFAKSITIMADAFNNITDMTSSILTIIGFKLSSKELNEYRPYMYMKYEYISSIIISIIMFILGIIFFIKSINKIIIPQELIINYTMYIILIISLVIKYIQYKILKDFSLAINSKTLKTNSLETRNDIITNISILLSMIIMKIFNINIDGYLGLIVSIFIIYTSFNNIKNEIIDLLYIDNDNKINRIKSKLLSYDYIDGLHNLIIHSYGNNNYYMTVHVEINDNMEFNNIYKVINEIENDIEKQFNINLTIHIDQVNVN